MAAESRRVSASRRPGRATQPPIPAGSSLPLALARAVARIDQASLLAADNTRATVDGSALYPIDQALALVDAGVVPSCFVDVADDILACDGDRGHSRQLTLRLARRCQSAGVSFVILESGRPGHRHLFARVPDPVLLDRLAGEARALHLDVRRSIRPPGTPHRLGRRVRLIHPATWEEALRALGGCRRPPPAAPRIDAVALPVRATPPPTTTRRELSATMATVLATGCHPDAGRRCPQCRGAHAYHSRSEVVQAIALGAVDRGWTEDDLWAALSDHRNVGGLKVQELTRRRGVRVARRYVHRCFEVAVAHAKARPAYRDQRAGNERLDLIAAAIQAAAWRGVAGTTDRAVLLAHLDLARRAGGPIHNASMRDVAEIALVSDPTVRRSHRRLIVTGWLAPVRGARKPGHAKRWELLLQDEGGAPDVPMQASWGCESVGTYGAGGLWRRRAGLGLLAQRVYGLLGVEPRPRSEIAGALGRRSADGSLRRTLGRLAKHGLATSDAGGWRRGSADPLTVAEMIGATEADARHRARRAQERARFQEELEAQRSAFRAASAGNDEVSHESPDHALAR